MDIKGLNKLLDIYKEGEFFTILEKTEQERFDKYIDAFVYNFPDILPTEIIELVTGRMLCERVDMAFWNVNLDDMDSSVASTVKTIIETSRKYRNGLLDYYKNLRKDQKFGDLDMKDSFTRALIDIDDKDGNLKINWVGDKDE